MSSKKTILVDLLRGILQCIKGTPYNRHAYEELFKVLYDLFRTARRDGLIALESHLSEPEKSTIFAKYPLFAGNRHAMDFACGALSPVLEGTVKPEQIGPLLEADIRLLEAEHHVPLGVLSKTADAMPGFGIVAAVLGIVITMGAIDGPAEQIGEKVGAALVGTFLGILMAYGFLRSPDREAGIAGGGGNGLLPHHRHERRRVRQRAGAEGRARSGPARRRRRVPPHARGTRTAQAGRGGVKVKRKDEGGRMKDEKDVGRRRVRSWNRADRRNSNSYWICIETGSGRPTGARFPASRCSAGSSLNADINNSFLPSSLVFHPSVSVVSLAI